MILNIRKGEPSRSGSFNRQVEQHKKPRIVGTSAIGEAIAPHVELFYFIRRVQ